MMKGGTPGFPCPHCKHPRTAVIGSGYVTHAAGYRRRRECLKCLHRFTTYEIPVSNSPRVIESRVVEARELIRAALEALDKTEEGWQ